MKILKNRTPIELTDDEILHLYRAKESLCDLSDIDCEINEDSYIETVNKDVIDTITFEDISNAINVLESIVNAPNQIINIVNTN